MEERKLRFYKVVWDNGSNGSGEFDDIFYQWKDADQFGKNWADDMNALEPIPADEEGYTYEIMGYFSDGQCEIIEDGPHDEYQTDEEENYDLDHELAQILDITIDELDSLSLHEVHRLRKVLKVTKQNCEEAFHTINW